jgi:hypothetical protein
MSLTIKRIWIFSGFRRKHGVFNKIEGSLCILSQKLIFSKYFKNDVQYFNVYHSLEYGTRSQEIHISVERAFLIKVKANQLGFWTKI